MSGNNFLSSKARHRIMLEQPVETPDGAGGFTRGWEEAAQLWAEITPLSPRDERLRSEQLTAQPAFRVRLRTGVTVTAAMRLVHGTRIFEITAISEPPDAKEPLVLTVVENT